jgi:integrase
MASVFRPSGRTIYRIEFKDQHGQTRVVSSGMKDRRAAEGLAHLLERDAELIRGGREPRDPELTAVHLGLVHAGALTWKAFRERFEEEVLSGLRERTREKYDCVLDVFEQEIQPGRLRSICEETVSRFAAALRKRPVRKRGKLTGQIGLSPWSVKNYLIALKTALGWAVEQKLLPAVPNFPTIKVPKKKPQPISEADWEKLYRAAPDWLWRAYLLCGWLGGLRLSEAHHLRRSPSEDWPWVDWQADRIILPAKFVKSCENQWVPLHPSLRDALAAVPLSGDEFFPFRSRKTGGPLTRNGLTNRVLHMAQRAGVKLSMHRLRKGFGCRVAQQLGRGNAPVLHRLMRHSSMQITMYFYASVDDVLHDAIRQLDGGEADPGQQERAG